MCVEIDVLPFGPCRISHPVRGYRSRPHILGSNLRENRYCAPIPRHQAEQLCTLRSHWASGRQARSSSALLSTCTPLFRALFALMYACTVIVKPWGLVCMRCIPASTTVITPRGRPKVLTATWHQVSSPLLETGGCATRETVLFVHLSILIRVLARS